MVFKKFQKTHKGLKKGEYPKSLNYIHYKRVSFMVCEQYPSFLGKVCLLSQAGDNNC